MKRTVLTVLCVAEALIASTATAAVISRDWKTPGDGLLRYDDVNKREWLDLSQTVLSDQLPVGDPSPQVTRENRCQYVVVSQTNVSVLFEGFTVKKNTPEFLRMLLSARRYS